MCCNLNLLLHHVGLISTLFQPIYQGDQVGQSREDAATFSHISDCLCCLRRHYIADL